MRQTIRYFFDVFTDEKSLSDEHGIELGCEDEACSEAETVAFKILEEGAQPHGLRRVVVEVRDGGVRCLYRVSVEAERAASKENSGRR